jgi:hypothetical protein
MAALRTNQPGLAAKASIHQPAKPGKTAPARRMRGDRKLSRLENSGSAWWKRGKAARQREAKSVAK